MNRGISEQEFLDIISSLPEGTFWRHNQAGDLPHNNGNIDSKFLRKLVKANAGKDGFTYTHHKHNKRNLGIIRMANENGFTINLSANGLDEATEYVKTGLPVVTVIPSDNTKKKFEHKGTKIVVCPATYSNKTCATCGLCQKRNRNFVIAFPAHGTQKKVVDKIVSK